MFKEAVIHYPADEDALKKIHKELAAFRCAAAVKYIKSINLNDIQIEALYAGIADEIKKKRQSGN